jgi:DNA-binding NarL/FixJ family response regulator
VATAANEMEAVAKAHLHQPNIAIIDVSMPLMNGIEATRQIRASCPTTRVMNFSLYAYRVYVKNALQAGATGYILKEGFANELLEAIQSVYNGSSYFSRKIARFVEPPFVVDNE